MGTKGQGKNRGEERESAEQWEQGGIGWGTGTGGQGNPFPAGGTPGATLLCADINLSKEWSRISIRTSELHEFGTHIPHFSSSAQ